MSIPVILAPFNLHAAMAKSVQGVNALDGGRSPGELVRALDKAKTFPGLSLISLPVYMGENELGGLGVFGRWNVGNCVEETQNLRHKIGL